MILISILNLFQHLLKCDAIKNNMHNSILFYVSINLPFIISAPANNAQALRPSMNPITAPAEESLLRAHQRTPARRTRTNPTFVSANNYHFCARQRIPAPAPSIPNPSSTTANESQLRHRQRIPAPPQCIISSSPTVNN